MIFFEVPNWIERNKLFHTLWTLMWSSQITVLQLNQRYYIGRCPVGTQNPVERGEGRAVAGMEKVIPEGKNSILCTVLKFCPCVLGFSTVHTLFCWEGLVHQGGACLGSLGSPVAQALLLFPETTGFWRPGSCKCHSWDIQSPNRFTCLPPSPMWCSLLWSKMFKEKKTPDFTARTLMSPRTELAFWNLHQKSSRSLY